MIRIYQKENHEIKKANNFINDLVEKNIKIASVMIRATPIMETLTGFMIAGFIIYSGKLIAAGELGVNNFFSFLAAMMLAYQPIRSLATINMAVYQGAAAFKRIEDIINKDIKVREIEGSPKLKITKSEIKFNKVIKYDTTQEKAIKNVSFNIDGNSMVAFVATVEYKSTIINLLPRFYDPQEGVIEIDGQNIKNVSLISLRKTFYG